MRNCGIGQKVCRPIPYAYVIFPKMRRVHACWLLIELQFDESWMTWKFCVKNSWQSFLHCFQKGKYNLNEPNSEWHKVIQALSIIFFLIIYIYSATWKFVTKLHFLDIIENWLSKCQDPNKNVSILQVGWPFPVPPTLPAIRVVLIHTEAFV